MAKDTYPRVEPNDKSTRDLPKASVNDNPTRKEPGIIQRIEGDRK